MTDEHIRKLIRMRMEASWSIQQKIVDAVKVLKNPQVRDIKSYLDREAGEEVDHLYSLGMFSSVERDKKLRRKIITKRTIYRNLKKLIRFGLIEHTAQRYAIPDYTKPSRVMIHPEYFGEDLLYSLMEFPFSSSIEVEIPELMQRFGILVGLCFLESMMPHLDKIDPELPTDSFLHYHKRPPLTSNERDDLVLYWVEKSIPIQRMFELFLLAVTSDKKGVSNCPDSPSYEVSVKTAKKVARAIKLSFPDVYQGLIKHRNLWRRKSPNINAGL